MAEPALDVKASVRLVRRLWPWMAATCLLGAVAGATVQLLRIAPYHASSLVLLPTSAGTTATAGHATTITTDARIAESAVVLTPAAAQAGGDLSLAQLQASVSATPAAAGVLKITAASSSASQAKRIANAVAEQLVAFVTTSGSAATRDQGTQVIQRAQTATGLSPADLVLPVVLGVIGGLVVGYVAIVVFSRRDRRLRTRDAIAEAVGAPVLLSMEERPPKSPKDWAELLENYLPPASTQWHIRRGLRELGIGEGGPDPKVLRMLAFGDDDGAAAAAVEIALVCASTGAETLFSIAGLPDEQVAVRSVCARFDAEDRKPRPLLAIHNGLRKPVEVPGDVLTELHILDRAEPEAGASWNAQDKVVLVVSAGRVTAEDLARAAIAVDAIGLRVGGVALVNPASEDRTVGRFSDSAVRRTLTQRKRPAETGAHVAPPRSQ